MSPSGKKGEQLGLALEEPPLGWGGKRDGAGRKNRGKTSVPHVVRPFHEKARPVHVTYRALPVMGNLRLPAVADALRSAIAAATGDDARAETFRVCHYTVQSNHVHLIVEATSAKALSRGMQGLASGMARRANLARGRHGQVWAERYHASEKGTPTEVRRVLAYVLLNRAHHVDGRPRGSRPPVKARNEWVTDDCSSGAWFDGWAWNPYGPEPPPHRPVAPPTTWLLRTGWRRGGGYIDPREVPGS